MTGVHLLARPLLPREAAQVAGWSYPPPYDVYDLPPGHAHVLLQRDGEEGYVPAVDDAGSLVAYACLGAEARVRGQEPVPGVLDVGLGVRPDLVGSGVGTALLPQVLALAGPRAVRVAVAAGNARSLALCRRAGLVEVRRFDGPGDRAFVELLRPPPRPDTMGR